MAIERILIVEESDPGTPAEDLPHIFERFYHGRENHAVARTMRAAH